MRDHHHVDRLRIQTRSGHVGGELSIRALAVDVRHRAIACINHNQLATGIDHQRCVVDREDVTRQERLLQRGVDLLLLRIGDEGILQRNGRSAIGNHRDLDVADFIAVETRRLFVRQRCGRLHEHGR